MAPARQELRQAELESKLERALAQVRTVLDATRNPQPAADVHHAYQDKYLLAECLSNTATASQVNCLLALVQTFGRVVRMGIGVGGSLEGYLCGKVSHIRIRFENDLRMISMTSKFLILDKCVKHFGWSYRSG